MTMTSEELAALLSSIGRGSDAADERAEIDDAFGEDRLDD
ncbi:hypothetical protein NSERUTF1_1010 [Nocardia seriolae]|nr:hypothetical protein NSERUTF1_1010 [Nocardia seriolae]